jgi:hypothetical protein
MKNVLKTGLFYFVAFSMVIGNSVINIDFSTAMAHAEELGETVETTSVVPYPDPNPVQAEWGVDNNTVTVTWNEITDDRFDGYKVVFSETDPNPVYPTVPHIAYITDSTVTSYVHDYEFVCGQDYHYSVTARYDDGSHYVAGNAVTLNFACEEEEPEPNCEGADAEFVVGLEVMGLNCGSQNLPAYDYEDINLSTGAGSYEVYTVAKRSDINEDSPYGQDNEEFTVRVNSSLEGPIVVDQSLPSIWDIQNAGTFDFVDGSNTVHMDTAFECTDPSSMDRNSVEVTKLCLYKVEEPEEELATVIAHKIVCDEETDLPNWSGGANITADTAQNYVDTHPNCHFASDWKFEWGTNNSLLDLDGDYIGEHNVAGWYDFDSLTDVNGKAEVELNLEDLSGKTWFREVLQDDYIPYSFPPGSNPGSDISAEFWCNSDVVNYDNAEWINDIAADDTYYCVAFNVEIQEEEECSLEDSLLVNGSFEEPVVTNGSLWQKMSSVLGWIIEKVSDDSATTLELHRGWSANVASDGLQYSELDGDHSTRIIQEVATEAGAEYKLFWSFAPRHNIAAEQNHLGVKVDDTQVATNGPATGSAPLSQGDWEDSNYVFLADDTSTSIAFEDIGPSNSYGTFLDDARLCKVADAETDYPPVITLIGSPIINIDHSATYTDEGATADDVEDGDITGDIATVNPVDTSVLGVYTITYNVTDSDGNHATEVTRTVIVGAPYAPWCSVLLGAMRDFYNPDSSAYGLYNEVIDVYTEDLLIETINLSDLALLTQMYYEADDDVCYAQFEDPEDEFHFQCEDPEVGWCGGLLQGITDSINRPDRYFEVFDLYTEDNLNVINLSDLVIISQLLGANDQVACYTYYVPPFLMCENPEPYCGDGNVDEGEQCDAGPEGSDTCNTQCEVIETGCVTNCGGGGGGSTTASVFNVDVDVTCEATTITWQTSRNSLTWMYYSDESGTYSSEEQSTEYDREHSVVLEDLEYDTEYFYKIATKTTSGRESKKSEISFTTPPKEQCEEVLGEKIEEPLICDFLRPSGSTGGDEDIDGVFHYPNGSLLRDACVPEMPVYLIRDQKKWHIPTWQYLHDHHFDERIYNVISSVANSYEDWTAKVLGIKEYADGTLLRGSDMKIYVLEKGQKRHVISLQELIKYAGQEIINVSDEVLDRY